MASVEPASLSARPALSALAQLRARTGASPLQPPAPSELQRGPAQPPRDTVNLFGVPAAELTPAVRAALQALAGEVQALRADAAILRQRLAEAEGLADVDPLSQVLNRRGFLREMQRTMALADRIGVPASLVFFDLNGFKQINDRYGHPAGDAVLRGIAQTLAEQVRGSDVVGRLGGDEFAVLLAKAGPDEARRKGAQLAEAIRATVVSHGRERLRIGTAFGTYTVQRGDTPEQAIARADEAMYLDKQGRRVVSL